MCLYGKWKWEKLSRKASRETAQLKDRVKDLVNAIEGVFCDIFYCYKGAYWGPKVLLHIKKNTGLLNVERRAIRMVGDFSIRRVKRSCSLQLQKKKKKRVAGPESDRTLWNAEGGGEHEAMVTCYVLVQIPETVSGSSYKSSGGRYKTPCFWALERPKVLMNSARDKTNSISVWGSDCLR